MWLRSEIKERGKQNFKKSYLYAIAASLVFQLAAGFTINLELSEKISTEPKDMIHLLLSKFVIAFAGFVADNLMVSYVLILFIVTLLVKLFLCYPMEIGVQKFYITKPEEERRLYSLISSFISGHYTTHICTLFKRDLFIVLWSLLFAIPGIIKAYEYRMIPYLLAENEDMTSEEAFQRSRIMMNGQKWNVFVLDLSFMLWHLLSLFTLNLVGIFFARPYYDATNAELYLELSR